MHDLMMKFEQTAAPVGRNRLQLAGLLAAVGLALSGCVVYPSSYGGYGGGYGGYYAAPAVVAAPVVVGGGWGWGWGRGWGRGGWR